MSQFDDNIDDIEDIEDKEFEDQELLNILPPLHDIPENGHVMIDVKVETMGPVEAVCKPSGKRRMIVEAIATLKQKEGANKSAISKNIEFKYVEIVIGKSYQWHGEVLNNIRVSSERFREKREDDNLLDEELDKHLDDIINQTHATLTLGPNDEMEVDDTQILVDEDPYLPSQPPPGKKAKPWSRDKIGGGRKRKVTIPPRTSQQQTEGQQNEDQAHSSRGSRIQVETHFEEAGGPETQFDIGGPETQFDIGGPETQFGGQSQPQSGVNLSPWGSPNLNPKSRLSLMDSRNHTKVQYSRILRGETGSYRAQTNTLRMRTIKEKGKNETFHYFGHL
ncbi:OLC1v1001727C1 [Oldenlandia corymbosa var. corymbosa]|uniref:OLC1v1001727C1 n=1 Tax=Oldenlandia corymbosa var. corymbosa TaxID=529605 RepID=A0AAV1D8R4_OLDCO|nr:OLC1v1001727C1 [Oldenlandia corymbosa var. corymbosa]